MRKVQAGHFRGELLLARPAPAAKFSDVANVEVSFRGYLSNHNELAAALGLDRSATSPELIRAGFARWGRNLPARLDGQFALVVCDLARGEILVARDALGVIPLYWEMRGSMLRYATRLADLVDRSAPPTLDLEEVERYILFGGAVSTATCYKTIKRLEPGTSLWIQGGRNTIDTYWDPRALDRVRYPNATDYIDRFQELVDRSVRGSLREARVPWIALSGGLDSNTVLHPAIRACPDLQAYSIVAPDWADEDESPWIRRIVERRGIRWTPINAEEILPFHELPREFCGSPDAVVLYDKLWKRLNALVNGDVLLTGDGGDSFMGAQMGPIPTHLADSLFRRDPGGVLGEIREWSAQSTPERSIGHWLVHALLLPSLRHVLRRNVRQPHYHLHPAWLRCGSSRFAKSRPLQAKAVAPHCPAPGQQAILDDLWQCAEDTTAAAKTFSNRHPLFDRKLFEFLWAIPWSQKLLPRCDRYLQRRALKNVVDDDIRTRIGYGIGSRCLIEGLGRSHLWRDYLCESPALAKIGFVDAEQWRLAVAQASVGQTNAEPLFVRAITVEVWLKQLAEDRSGSCR